MGYYDKLRRGRRGREGGGRGYSTSHAEVSVGGTAIMSKVKFIKFTRPYFYGDVFYKNNIQNSRSSWCDVFIDPGTNSNEYS